jgi:hypothetical protein
VKEQLISCNSTVPILCWSHGQQHEKCLWLQEMLHAEQKELENFLTHIYRAIASAAPLKDKVCKK